MFHYIFLFQRNIIILQRKRVLFNRARSGIYPAMELKELFDWNHRLLMFVMGLKIYLYAHLRF